MRLVEGMPNSNIFLYLQDVTDDDAAVLRTIGFEYDMDIELPDGSMAEHWEKTRRKQGC